MGRVSRRCPLPTGRHSCSCAAAPRSTAIRNCSPDFPRTFVQADNASPCIGLEWDGQKKKAVAAIYCDRQTMAHHRVSASAFVVACGPLNSPKLLFNSACNDHPNGMGNSAGLLGKYLHDHPREWWPVDVDTPLTSLSPPAYFTRLPYASSHPLLASSWTLGPIGTVGTVKSRFGLKTTYFGVQVFGTMVPEEKYYVGPARDDKDQFGFPALEVHIGFDETF